MLVFRPRTRRCAGDGHHAPAWLLSLCFVAGAACHGGPRSPTPSAPVVLRVGIAQPIGVPTAAAAVSQVARRLTFASLVTIASDGTVLPGLADTFQVSLDGRTWRFTIRPGLKFSDGSPLEASAVAASLSQILGRPDVGPGLEDIVRVATPSPQEVTIELREQSSFLLEALSFVSIEGRGQDPATAGPYRRDASEADMISLAAFRDYYRGPPQVDRVELKGYPSPRAAWVALMRADIDFLYDVPADATEFVEASSDIQSFAFLRSYVQLLGFNTRYAPLRDARVRRAVALAVDRSAIVRGAFAGRATPAYGAVWPKHWAYDAAIGQPKSRDLARARDLLASAGLAHVPVVGKPRPALTLSCLVPAGYASFERIALILQRQLLDIGIDFRPEVLPVGELTKRLAEGRFETYLFEQATGQGLHIPYLFWHSPGRFAPLIQTGYAGADMVLDRIRHAKDREALSAAVHGFQQALADDPPAVFLVWTETARAVRRRFVIADEPGHDIFASLPQWRVSPQGTRP